MKKHLIKNIINDSIAFELGVKAGDILLEIDGIVPKDIFDYQFMITNEYLELLILKPDGEEWLLEINKDEDEDLGIEFAVGLMDEYHSCQNKCIFCFIDQMPPGLRETLYFKDDDARLSFLEGNYITLTNMSDFDIKRIIRYHLSPINISIHTTNPLLRCKMLNNSFAGEALKKIDQLYEAGIKMNGQIVLCKGVNDGTNLKKSIRDLSKYLPYLESVSVVPAGLTKYRDGLFPLEEFTRKDAGEVLDIIHCFSADIFQEFGTHFVHASDEWYMLAGRKLPGADAYDGYPQLENGVGMIRLFLDEFLEAMPEFSNRYAAMNIIHPLKSSKYISIATGLLAFPFISCLIEYLTKCLPGLEINVYGITNHFFGENITVSGLLTGTDIINQLKSEELGERLLLPENVLRNGEDVFLDGITVMQLENALQVQVDIVKSSGREFIEAILKSKLGKIC